MSRKASSELQPDLIKLIAEDGSLKPIGSLGSAPSSAEVITPLSEILQHINAQYGVEVTGVDTVRHLTSDMQRRMREGGGFRQALNREISPSPETRRHAFDSSFGHALEGMIDLNLVLYEKIGDYPGFAARFRAFIYQAFAG